MDKSNKDLHEKLVVIFGPDDAGLLEETMGEAARKMGVAAEELAEAMIIACLKGDLTRSPFGNNATDGEERVFLPPPLKKPQSPVPGSIIWRKSSAVSFQGKYRITRSPGRCRGER